ncbi:unnamed protein product [Sphagnum balticum]
MSLVSDIKLIRTDTTLDLSQKAEKAPCFLLPLVSPRTSLLVDAHQDSSACRPPPGCVHTRAHFARNLVVSSRYSAVESRDMALLYAKWVDEDLDASWTCLGIRADLVRLAVAQVDHDAGGTCHTLCSAARCAGRRQRSLPSP